MRRTLVAGAAALAALAGSAPVSAKESAQDDLRWVGTGGAPAVNFSGRYVAFEAAVPGPTVIGWRDMKSSRPSKQTSTLGQSSPSIADGWTQVTWQEGSTDTDQFCGLSDLYRVWAIDKNPLTQFVGSPFSSRLMVSVQNLSLGGAAANASSTHPVLSRDGSHVAFESRAGNLAPGVANAGGCSPAQIYLRDIRPFASYSTDLVSVAANGDAGDRNSFGAAVSQTGRYVAFESGSTNLVPGDTSFSDVFVRDTVAGTTTIVSHANGSTAGIGGSQAAISGDGRYVAYVAPAPPGTLDADGFQVGQVVYVRDMDFDTAVIVSRTSGPNGTPLRGDRPSMSTNGRYVSFMTDRSAAVPDPVTLTVPNCVVRDLATGENRLATRRQGPTGAPLDVDDGGRPRLSGNGRYLVFWTSSDTLSKSGRKGQPDIYRRDVWGPAASGDVVAPVLSGVALTAKSFAQAVDCTATPPALSSLDLTSSEDGTLTVEFIGKVARKTQVIATLTQQVAAGRTSVPLTGCVGTVVLPKGPLKLRVRVTDAAWNPSNAKTLPLKVN